MRNRDVIIIGGGAIGAFTLFHLAKRGISNCLLLEKENSSGLGATGSWGSLIRTMHLSPITTQKATICLPTYQHFPDLVGGSARFSRCGSLYFIKNDQLPALKAHLALLSASNIPYEIIDAERGKKAFPHFNWFDNDMAIYEENAGTACPHATTQELINYGVRKGAEARFNESVLDIKVAENRIFTVVTPTQQYLARHVVIAAGRWSKSLAQRLGVDLMIHEKSIQINRFCRTHFKASIPLFIDRNLASFGHFFPDGSFAGGYLPAADATGKPSERLSISDANQAKMQISKRLNWIKNASLEGGIRAIESYSDNGQGIIDNNFAVDNLTIAAGFSCTGFTLAPYAGGLVADGIMGTVKKCPEKSNIEQTASKSMW
jgi:sarcosine oxidase